MTVRVRLLAASCLALPLALTADAAIDPIFSEVPPLDAQSHAIFAVAADVDADGDQDLVSADYSSDTVSWYENDGASPPLWTRRDVDNFAMGPQRVAAADLDDDGDLDVFSTNFNDESVHWYENSGTSPPTWTKRLVSHVSGAWGVHVADLDGDGDADAMGGNRWDIAPEHKGVEWYENNGASPPSFTVRRVSAGFVDAASVDAADVDGDGDIDILSVDVFRDSVYWYENSGTQPPVWTQHTITAAADDPFWVSPADVDGDGDVDVLAASAEDDTIAWHENNGAQPPTWTRRVITNQAPQVLAVFAGDLDGDGDVDAVSGVWGSEIAWYESNGASPPSFTRRLLSTRCQGAESVFAARLDADADVDLLATCSITGQVHWFPSGVAQADVDSDGVPDALDCAPADSTAFAIPAVARDVRFETKTALLWNIPASPAGSGTVYDVLRGTLGSFPVGSTGEVCSASRVATTLTTEASPLPAGTGRYYLVRAVNACGAGSYGATSSGIERTSAACP